MHCSITLQLTGYDYTVCSYVVSWIMPETRSLQPSMSERFWLELWQ